jgi:hypothetical protein
LIAGAGFALLAVPGVGGSYWTTFFAPATVLGLGMALTVAPLTTVVMSAVSEEHTGVASGINNAVARVASLVAIAVFGLVITSRFAGALGRQLDGLGTASALKQRLEDQRNHVSGLDIPADISGQQGVLLQRAVSSAYVDAFRIAMLLAATLAVAGAGAAWTSTRPGAGRVRNDARRRY